MSSCLNVTQFGTAVVFLLLASKNIESFLRAFGGPEIGFCLLVLVVAAFMLPFTMLKSPKDFWYLLKSNICKQIKLDKVFQNTANMRIRNVFAHEIHSKTLFELFFKTILSAKIIFVSGGPLSVQ